MKQWKAVVTRRTYRNVYAAKISMAIIIFQSSFLSLFLSLGLPVLPALTAYCNWNRAHNQQNFNNFGTISARKSMHAYVRGISCDTYPVFSRSCRCWKICKCTDFRIKIVHLSTLPLINIVPTFTMNVVPNCNIYKSKINQSMKVLTVIFNNGTFNCETSVGCWLVGCWFDCWVVGCWLVGCLPFSKPDFFWNKNS